MNFLNSSIIQTEIWIILYMIILHSESYLDICLRQQIWSENELSHLQHYSNRDMRWLCIQKVVTKNMSVQKVNFLISTVIQTEIDGSYMSTQLLR